MNIELIAVQVGDALKYKRSVKEINRRAEAVFQFPRKGFPNESITSERSQLIYDWIMSLGHHSCSSEERKQLLITFIKSLTPEIDLRNNLLDILSNCDVDGTIADGDTLERFDSYQFHSEIIKHCRKLYGQENYFHAVFEAAKVYNGLVKSKAQSAKDGESLMLSVWDPQSGVLKVNSCTSETDLNVQNGIKFLSAGLMRAVRNPTAHELALQWLIDQQDATDILSFVSFLLRQYDKAVYSAP